MLAAKDKLAMAGSVFGSGITPTASRLERIVLDHDPKSLAEAVAMLDVALPDLECGGRTDGRDVRAVHRVRDFLSRYP